MIHQKDWFMRQIEMMVSAILHFITLTDISEQKISQTEQELRESISKAIQNGQLCETEDWLLENVNASDIKWLELAVFYYSEINKYSDAYLENHNFSREEIQSGLLEITEKFGIRGIL